jgi:hypothetical protein
MKLQHRVLFAGLPTLLAVTAFAAEPAPTSMPALDPQTAALIQQLDSDDYHTRQSATDS